jgi:NhaA family Na+:H+ antiporter
MSRRVVRVRTVGRFISPVGEDFVSVEALGGLLIVASAIAAMLWANLAPGTYDDFWGHVLDVGVGDATISLDLRRWLNDGLMAIFFFVVGLEIKRELVTGDLRDRRTAALPVLGAVGGMVVPAAIFASITSGTDATRGWAIPMATDIAFVVGFLALFGRRVPFGLKILLLSLAIVDDLVAVLIIAFVFTETLSWNWLGLAAGAFGIVYGFHRIGVRSVGVYVVIGTFIWLAFLQSGVHPTVAGVLLGLLTPAHAWIGRDTFADVLKAAWQRASGEGADRYDARADAGRTQIAVREAVSPLQRLEHGLHPWVAFLVMPVFALANAGVVLSPSSLGEPVAVAVAAGLAFGKPIGIMISCVLAVRSRVTSLPDGVTWGMLAGGACLAGIGFTMALFLNALAFPVADFPANEAAGKIGTLAGSLVSAVLGAVVLSLAVRRRVPH